MKNVLVWLLFSLALNIPCGWAQTSPPAPPPVSNAGLLPGPTANIKIEGQTYISEKLIPGAVSGFVTMLLAVSVILIILAGLFFIFSSGESELKEKAKNVIFWTILGVILAILSVAIVKFVIGINFSGT